MQTVLIWGIWVLLLAVALWRVALAGQVAANSSLVAMEGAVVIQWRRLDEFVPWIGIGVLISVEGRFCPGACGRGGRDCCWPRWRRLALC